MFSHSLTERQADHTSIVIPSETRNLGFTPIEGPNHEILHFVQDDHLVLGAG